MSLTRVVGDDELYIGGLVTVLHSSRLETAKITHIVSVLRYDFERESAKVWKKYRHCSVQVDDVEDENLICEFARTNAFVKEALAGGGRVLVHCAMGKSRSATVIIAYLLATRPTTCPTVSSALSLLRQTRPMAEPNRGFMAQLELYKSMGCPTNIDSQPPYQRWLYKQEVELSIAASKVPDWIRFEDEETQDDAREREKELRCRKCRRTLATAQYLVPHVPKSSSPATTSSSTLPVAAVVAPSPSSPGTAPTTSLPTPASTPCTHHFLHPLSWMRPTLERGELAGRLECPNEKCRVSVGRYAWQGFECSCGEWVVPAFSLAAGKIDEVTKGGGKGATVGVRMPPGIGRGSL